MYVARLAILALAAGTATLHPPVAKKIPHIENRHGIRLEDDYAWLKDTTRANPEVVDHLNKENAFTQEVMRDTTTLQQKLYDEMLKRINETDSSVPEKVDDYYYYYRTAAGKQYRIYCRRHGSMDAHEEIMVDENKLAEGQKYFSMRSFEVSPDHRYLAYSVDFNGSEAYTLHIKDLKSGELLAEAIDGTYDAAWAADSKTLFYVTIDAAHRPYKLYRHQLGEAGGVDKDAMVYHEADDAYYMGIRRTKDDRYLLLYLESKNTTEYRMLRADRPQESFTVFKPRQHGIEYSIDHHEERFFLLTNEKAKDFRLLAVPEKDFAKAKPEEILPHEPLVKLDGIEVFKDYLAVFRRVRGLKEVLVLNLRDGSRHDLKFPEIAYTFDEIRSRDYKGTSVRLSYSSMVTPRTVYDYDMQARRLNLLKRFEVMDRNFKSGDYVVERHYAKAHDGVEVPISLVYKKALRRPEGNPCLLYAYGSYGMPVEPGFNANRVSLLDRGFVVALAHIRGGGELGETWRDDGKMLKKRNTFDDFIVSAEYLISKHFTVADKLAIMGGSAGGMLMGAVTNMRPDLFKAVVAKVPFVDVINTMSDATLPLTVTEYDEWGNPNDAAYFKYMLSYSPYENVKPQRYPNILATAGLHDPRVSYWEPAKWIARLRELNKSGSTILLKTDMSSGHGGASGRYDYLKEVAVDFAFILKMLGIAN